MEQSITEILSNYIGNTLSDEEKARIEAERNEVDRQAAEDAQSGIKRYDQEEQDKLVRQFNPGTNNTAYYVKNLLEEDLRQTKEATLKTGFKQLDKLTGGLHPGLYMLGAIPSLGKSTFCLQLADQVAAQGKKVLFFTLEQTRRELVTKSLNRLAGSEHTREQIESDPELREHLIDEYIEMVENNLQIFDGTAIKNYAAIKGAIQANIYSKPMVIVDYLQILSASEEAKTTEKRLLTDYDVTRLKVLSRDFHIPVLVISAFNRMSYLESVSMGSFRESSGIEYSSDILLGMQYQGMDYQKHWFTTDSGKKKKVYENKQDHDMRIRELLEKMDTDGANGLPLPIELRILKNRNGSKGTLYYHFLPAYNYYEEKSSSSFRMEWGDDIPFLDSESKPKKTLGSK